MDENNKEKFALWLRPETKRMVEKNYKDDGCRSRSDFIEKERVFSQCHCLNHERNAGYF